MTDEQRRPRPPVVHPLFLTHPVTNRKMLYCSQGYAVRINRLPQSDSDATLDWLFAINRRCGFATLITGTKTTF